MHKPLSLAAAALLLTAIPAHAQMTLPGKFEVTDTGSASYTIPISVVPGTAGLEPKLSLQYDSRSGNGLLGVGWSLAGLPAITRCGRTIAQDGQVGGVGYDANDRFCLDGQRLVAISGTYGADGTEYRTERESFSKVISYGTAGSGPSWFKVWTKAGLIMEFGNSADSRIEAQGKQSVRVWALNRTQDTKSNYFTVSYLEDNANGEYRPDRIDYTGNATANTQPSNSVRFVYETRPDIVPLYQAGSLIKTTQRMTKVQVWQGNNLIRSYDGSFEVSSITSRSRMTSVQLCEGSLKCLPRLAFVWTAGAASFAAKSYWLSGQYGYGQGWSDNNTYPRVVADLNGDGVPDILGITSVDVKVSLGAANAFQSPQVWLITEFSQTQGWVEDARFPRMVQDVNGDGLPDMVGFAQGGVRVALNTGAAFSPAQTWLQGYFGTAQGWSDMNAYPRYVVDVNGDALPDIVGISSNAVFVALNTGGAFAAPQVWLNTEFTQTQGWTANGIFPRTIVDLNGDGLADIVGFSQSGVSVALNSGNGFAPATVWLAGYFGTAQGWSDNNTYPRVLHDVNGDGLPDIVAFASNAIYVSFNTGSAFSAPSVWLNTEFTQAQGWTDNVTFPRILQDVNGDGLADIVGFSQNGVVVSLGTGSAFLPKQNWLTGEFGTAQGWTNTNVYPRQLVDLKGDGMSGVVGFADGGVIVAPHLSAMPDRLAEIGNGQAATVLSTIALAGSNSYVRDTGASACAYPCVDVQGPLYVVSEVKSSNGLGIAGAGGEYRSTYRYAGAKSDLHGRGFLGFRQMRVKDEQTGVEQVTTYRQDYPFTGLVASREKKLGTQLLNRSSNTYDATNLGGTRRYPFLTQSLEESWELSGAALPGVTTGYQYDAWGNATLVSVSTGDGHGKTTTNTYANDMANWLLGRLQRSVVTSTTPGQ